MHIYLLLFYYVKCARLFSGFEHHSCCPCSCTLALLPPRGCSRPCRLGTVPWPFSSPDSWGCPSVGILPWRNNGCCSPNHARKHASCYTIRLTAQQCCVLFSLLEAVKTNLVYQTSATLLEPTCKRPYCWGSGGGRRIFVAGEVCKRNLLNKSQA